MLNKQIVIITTALLLGAAWSVHAAGPPFELAVKQDEPFGGSKGTLVFAEHTVEYRTADQDEVRQWSYLDLKQVRVVSPTDIELATYADQGRLKLGADRTYHFDVTQAAIGSDLVEFLLARVDRPLVTAVLPALPLQPRFRVPVKYQRFGKGSEGALLLYDQGLAYVTERERDARYWRFRDLFSILSLDRYRLELRAYEGDGGETRPFTFQLKTELPADMYEALWRATNLPSPTRPSLKPALAAASDASSRAPDPALNEGR
jgi:hypothetical protein